MYIFLPGSLLFGQKVCIWKDTSLAKLACRATQGLLQTVVKSWGKSNCTDFSWNETFLAVLGLRWGGWKAYLSSKLPHLQEQALEDQCEGQNALALVSWSLMLSFVFFSLFWSVLILNLHLFIQIQTHGLSRELNGITTNWRHPIDFVRWGTLMT